MTGAKEKVTLTVDGVNACDRYLLNRASLNNAEDRGDVLSRLMRDYAVQTFGIEHVEYMIKRFEEERSSKQDYKEAAKNTSTASSFDLEP